MGVGARLFVLLLLFVFTGYVLSDGSFVLSDHLFERAVPAEPGVNLNSTGLEPKGSAIFPKSSPSEASYASLESNRSYQTYSWDYGGASWRLSLLLDEELYREYRARTRDRDYDLFASDPYDDELIGSLAAAFLNLSRTNGLDEALIPGICVSFVQSLNYSSDFVSTGYDEYPRFPYETLYDRGGDCEDSAIFSVALLQEMGYDAVLLEMPDHMALGIKCDPSIRGSRIYYNGNYYYYTEMTGSAWDIGEMPDEYKESPIKVVPVYKRPVIDLDFRARCDYSEKQGVIDVNVTLENVGTRAAENITVLVILEAPEGHGPWAQVEKVFFQIRPEETYSFTTKGLRVPAGEKFCVCVQAFGDDLISEEILSDWFTLPRGA